MKNILITTDFSENSMDAAHYGIELARLFRANVTLMHVYSLPIPNAEFPEMIDFSAYEKIKKNKLEKLKDKIKKPGVQIDIYSKAGFSFHEEVQSFCEEKKLDLIVMGLTGSSRIHEILLGSNTMTLFAHSTVPILAVPHNYKFDKGLRMAFAFDDQLIKNRSSMDLLVEFASQLNTRIRTFHVSAAKSKKMLEETVKAYLPLDHITLDIEVNEDVDKGILEYITNNGINLLALIPRKHNFFDRLFHESHTREVALYSNIPLLVLPE